MKNHNRETEGGESSKSNRQRPKLLAAMRKRFTSAKQRGKLTGDTKSLSAEIQKPDVSGHGDTSNDTQQSFDLLFSKLNAKYSSALRSMSSAVPL